MPLIEDQPRTSASMAAGTAAAPSSTAALWTGRVLSAIAILFLLFDGITKTIGMTASVEGTVQLGYPASIVSGLGVTLLVCTVLYVIPRTAVLGALLLTGYLGGAVASQLRIGHPLLGFTLFPVYVAALAWGGLLLRDHRLRALIPIRR